jgi:DNA-binding NtrC family response regulator
MAAIEHACIVCDGNRILPATSRRRSARAARSLRRARPEPRPPRGGAPLPGAGPRAEREAIRQALEEAEGNRTRAAAALGMGRTTLWQKLKAYGLE